VKVEAVVRAGAVVPNIDNKEEERELGLALSLLLIEYLYAFRVLTSS
jgi:hypothetical protein